MASAHLQSVIRLLALKGNDDYSLITESVVLDTSDPTDKTVTQTTDNVQSLASSYALKYISLGIVQSSDIKLLVDPNTMSVDFSDVVKCSTSTTTYNVIDKKRIRDGDTVALYEFQIRE